MPDAATPAPGLTVRAIMAAVVDGADVPVWVRVGCAAWATADSTGHARFAPGELARRFGVSSAHLGNELAVARARGWIDPCSTSWCVVLPGCGRGRCEGRHR